MADDALLSTCALWVAAIALFQFVVSKPYSGGHIHPPQNGSDVVPSFPPRSSLHLQRKAQHAFTGLLIYAAQLMLPIDVATALLYAVAAFYFVLHELRKKYLQVDTFYLQSFGGILRQDEAAKRVRPGAFYFLLGTALVMTLFPLPVARLALLQLSIGDPAASLCGTLHRHYKKSHTSQTKPKRATSKQPKRRARCSIFGEHKSLAGVLGAFLASTLVSFVSFSFTGNPDTASTGQVLSATLCAKALFAGAAAATAEAIVVLDWDDNLTLPLLSGLLLQLGSHAFGFEY